MDADDAVILYFYADAGGLEHGGELGGVGGDQGLGGGVDEDLEDVAAGIEVGEGVEGGLEFLLLALEAGELVEEAVVGAAVERVQISGRVPGTSIPFPLSGCSARRQSRSA